jgi:hypothetical protein
MSPDKVSSRKVPSAASLEYRVAEPLKYRECDAQGEIEDAGGFQVLQAISDRRVGVAGVISNVYGLSVLQKRTATSIPRIIEGIQGRSVAFWSLHMWTKD